MVVLAILGASGVLAPDPENPPWIRREFLSPTATDSKEIPVVGSVDDFDRWLDRRPADVSILTETGNFVPVKPNVFRESLVVFVEQDGLKSTDHRLQFSNRHVVVRVCRFWFIRHLLLS
jgi:hypothetical protein